MRTRRTFRPKPRSSFSWTRSCPVSRGGRRFTTIPASGISASTGRHRRSSSRVASGFTSSTSGTTLRRIKRVRYPRRKESPTLRPTHAPGACVRAGPISCRFNRLPAILPSSPGQSSRCLSSPSAARRLTAMRWARRRGSSLSTRPSSFSRTRDTGFWRRIRRRRPKHSEIFSELHLGSDFSRLTILRGGVHELPRIEVTRFQSDWSKTKTSGSRDMRSALAATAILLLAACTANAPHRLTPQGQAVEATVHPGDLSTEEGRQRVESSALEVHDDFQLAFLEFDDQGSLYSRAPLELLIQTLHREAARPDSPRILLLLFAHGWKNNARICNRNVCCFRSLLSQLSADTKMVMERSKGTVGSFRTIGIFVGWRGLSATIPPFKELSFYARRRAAQSIGQGELVELLTFLDGFQKNLNERDPRRCRLVILGHSFGGAMLY